MWENMNTLSNYIQIILNEGNIMNIKHFYSLFISSIFILSMLFSHSVFAAKSCKEMSKSSCEKSTSCSWVKGYTTKKGNKVDAYCRNKAKKSAKKSSSKKDTKKTSEKKAKDKQAKSTKENKSKNKPKKDTKKSKKASDKKSKSKDKKKDKKKKSDKK